RAHRWDGPSPGTEPSPGGGGGPPQPAGDQGGPGHRLLHGAECPIATGTALRALRGALSRGRPDGGPRRVTVAPRLSTSVVTRSAAEVPGRPEACVRGVDRTSDPDRSSASGSSSARLIRQRREEHYGATHEGRSPARGDRAPTRRDLGPSACARRREGTSDRADHPPATGHRLTGRYPG